MMDLGLTKTGVLTATITPIKLDSVHCKISPMRHETVGRSALSNHCAYKLVNAILNRETGQESLLSRVSLPLESMTIM